MGFLAETGSRGLEGCQVPLGLVGMSGRGAHLEPRDRRDPQVLKAPVVHQDSQERGVYQARPALQVLQRLPVPTSPSRTTLVEKTRFTPTPSMTHEDLLFQDLRVPPGLSVLQVPEAR